jgi:hypothetical protein
VNDAYCSEAARAERAQLAGTATRADAWLLVEHRGPWGERAVDENDLPAAVQEWMRAQIGALKPLVGKVRPLLVRHDDAAAPTTFACFLAVAREDRRELYRLDVQSHLDLAGLDLAALLDRGDLEQARRDHGLVLVCGNGRRDRCCARFGVATWRALVASIGEEAWLSTHQGGHRYAGTGLWLPEGVAYGFLAPSEAEPLLAARGRGEIHLPCFRGRTFHDPPVQAADAMLRAERREAALDPWRLHGAVEESAGAWRVTFESASERHVVRLRRDTEQALVSCSPPKRKPIDRFTLSGIESEEAA